MLTAAEQCSTLTDRVTVWGAAGYGAGTLTLTPADGEAIETDMDLVMAAAGLRGVVVESPADGGPELAVKTDAMGVRTSSEATGGSAGGNLAAAEADVTRLRLGLEGTWQGPRDRHGHARAASRARGGQDLPDRPGGLVDRSRHRGQPVSARDPRRGRRPHRPPTSTSDGTRPLSAEGRESRNARSSKGDWRTSATQPDINQTEPEPPLRNQLDWPT